MQLCETMSTQMKMDLICKCSLNELIFTAYKTSQQNPIKLVLNLWIVLISWNAILLCNTNQHNFANDFRKLLPRSIGKCNVTDANTFALKVCKRNSAHCNRLKLTKNITLILTWTLFFVMMVFVSFSIVTHISRTFYISRDPVKRNARKISPISLNKLY